MKIKIYRTTYENGDQSLDIDYSHCPFNKVVREEEQEIEINEKMWKLVRNSEEQKINQRSKK